MHQAILEAEEQLKAGEMLEAVEGFLGVLDDDPAAVDAYLGLTRASLFVGKLPEAEAYLAEASRLAPERGEVLVLRGLLAEAHGDLQGALPHLQSAVDGEPASFLARYNLGRVLAASGRYQEALPHLGQATTLDPQSYEALYALGIALRGIGKLGAAIATFTRAMTLAPQNPDIYATLADLLVAAKDLDTARETLDEGLARAPGNPGLLDKAAAVATGRGDMPAAVAYLERLVEVQPGYARGWLNLATLCLLTKDLERSEQAGKRAADLAPEAWEPPFHLGNLYEGLRLDDQAEAAYRRAVTLAPGAWKALGNLGCLLLHADDSAKHEEALAFLTQADRLAPPGEWRPRYNLALAHVRLGRTAEAEAALASIFADAPPDDEAVHLARVLQANLAS